MKRAESMSPVFKPVYLRSALQPMHIRHEFCLSGTAGAFLKGSLPELLKACKFPDFREIAPEETSPKLKNFKV